MEINYEELFGLEAQTEQDVADPAPETEEVTEAPDNGEKEQEPAEPAEESGAQSSEENAKYAAARRKAEAERDKAIQEAKAAAQKEIDEAFRTSGFVNPYTGKPVQSKAEFDEYKARYSAETRKNVQDRAGMSDEEMQTFMQSPPEAVKAAEAERKLEAIQAAEFKERVEKEIAEIRQYEPEINSPEDFPKMENFQRFSELVQRGNTYLDAYKLANIDKITAATAAAAANAAQNKANSKQHLTATRSRGTGTEPVPADVMSNYRVFFPDASEEEIVKNYNKYLKGRK